MSRIRILALAAVVGAPLAAFAGDAPHTSWSNSQSASCDTCHVGHNASGAGLTGNGTGNANLCDSCHKPANQVGKGHGFPFSPSDQAGLVAGAGTSHSWSGATSGATAHGATTPTGSTLLLDTGNNLMCSTCHDPHAASRGGSQFVSFDPGVDTSPTSGVANGQKMQISAPVGTAAVAKGYRIDIWTAGQAGTNGAKFRMSHDGGKSWYGCSGSTFVVWNATTPNPCSATTTDFTMDDPNVKVRFTGTTFAVNDSWRFYVGYPFLRASNDEGQMCTTCHKDRNQNHTNVEGSGTTPGGQTVVLGTTVFSHPVGEALNANGTGNDRLPNAILDADGASTQLTGDGNKTNNLALSPTGKVTCLTCHSPHHADSNSLTVDVGQ